MMGRIRSAPVFVLAALLLAACSGGRELAVDVQAPLEVAALSEPTAVLEASELQATQPADAGGPADFVFPTVGPNPVMIWRPPPYPVPWAVRPEDHFFFQRPIPSGEVNWPNPTYRYGSTFKGYEPTHTGVDLGAERGTPVLAAGSGEVVWVGYGLYRGVYDETDPYGLAVAIRHDFGIEGQLLYTIYAHMGEAFVWDGQRVKAGEEIGLVGETGHASGPHLHFEIRLGENDFFDTRNPELWMVPPEGWGVLAGRVLDYYGVRMEEKLVLIQNVETGRVWEVWTYVRDTVHGDPYYDENFVISDLPSGPYEVKIVFNGKAHSAYLFVYPGQTNFLNFHARTGFNVETQTGSADRPASLGP